jgi:hypothetical protein
MWYARLVCLITIIVGQFVISGGFPTVAVIMNTSTRHIVAAVPRWKPETVNMHSLSLNQ